MLYKEAREIGEECGLSTPDEFIQNIIIHSPSYFGYSEINAEIRELLNDAASMRVSFDEKLRKLYEKEEKI